MILAALLFGLVWGSFLNVVIFRLGSERTIFWDRSRCFNCGKVLFWYELIPLVSFLLQKGRCRSCYFKISWQYPLVELITALASLYLVVRPVLVIPWVGLGSYYGLVLNYFLGLGLASIFIIIFFYDLGRQIIPDSLVFSLIIFSLLRLPFVYPLAGGGIKYILLVSLAISLFFAALWFISRGRWMGLGDAKLVFATSLLAGFPRAIGSAIFAFWLGALVSLVLLLFKKADLSTRLPFAPFIILGFLLSLLAAVPYENLFL